MKLTGTDDNPEIQRRNIEVSTYERGDAHIVVRGELCDRRLVPTTDLKGNPRSAGVVHRLRITMKVATRTMAIEEIEAQMLNVPHDECAGLDSSVDAIRGLTLTPGFTSRVKKKLGGRSGCIHLTTLLLAMAPAALQGYWVHNDRNPQRRRLSEEHLEQYLVDTCRVWRREGPLVKRIAEEAGVDFRKKDSVQEPDGRQTPE